MMKKKLTILILAALLLGGCASGRMGHPGAVMAGASIGGSLGSAIGGVIGQSNNGWQGGYFGSAIGNILGTVAGAAIGNAVSTPKADPTAGEERGYTPQAKRLPGTERHPETQLSVRRIRFIDDNRNHVIEGGETAKILFEVMNEGERPARNVLPLVEVVGRVKHLYLSPSVLLEEILPGEGIRYTASLRAGDRLKTGEVTFRVGVADEHGTLCDVQEFALPTRR